MIFIPKPLVLERNIINMYIFQTSLMLMIVHTRSNSSNIYKREKKRKLLQARIVSKHFAFALKIFASKLEAKHAWKNVKLEWKMWSFKNKFNKLRLMWLALFVASFVTFSHISCTSYTKKHIRNESLEIMRNTFYS